MTDCIFCKIIAGDIPCKKIFEDEHTLAFLDIGPSTKGHSLVIPKKHYKNIYEIPEEALSHIMSTAKKVANLLKEKLSCDGINIIQANEEAAEQSVFHIHFHVVPRYETDNFKFWPQQEFEGDLDEVLKEITS